MARRKSSQSIELQARYVAQTPSADHQTIRVSADQTVLDVKTLLVNFTHLPAEDQRLVHAGQAWDNDSMLLCDVFGRAAFASGLPLKIFIVQKRPPNTRSLKSSSGYEVKTRHTSPPNIRQESKEESLKRASDSESAYLNALHGHNLRIKQCRGDGNCLFRSISHQVYGTEQQHGLVRSRICDYMEADSHHFQNIAEADQTTGSQADGFARYLQIMRQNGVYGGHPEICAATEIYKRPVEIWAFDINEGARILPHAAGSGFTRPAIRLSFFRGGHYDSIISASFESALYKDGPPGQQEQDAIAYVQARQPGQYEAAISASRRGVAALNLDVHFDEIMRMSQTEYAQYWSRLEQQAVQESDHAATDDVILKQALEASKAANPTEDALLEEALAESSKIAESEHNFVTQEALIQVMQISGQDAPLARIALQDAFGHPDRAISYLLDVASAPPGSLLHQYLGT